MRIYVVALSLFCFSALCWTPVRAAVKDPHGIYCLYSAGAEPTADEVNNRAIDGITVRFTWAQLEPSPGTFDFSRVQLAYDLAQKYDKGFGLYVSASFNFPDWLDAPTVNVGTRSVPQVFAPRWTAEFMAAYTPFVQALADEYDGIDYIVIAGDAETHLSSKTRIKALFNLIPDPNGLVGLAAWTASWTTQAQLYAANFQSSTFWISAQNPTADSAGSAAIAAVMNTVPLLYPNRLGIKNSTLFDGSMDDGVNHFIIQYSPTNPVGMQCRNSEDGFGTAPPLGPLEDALDAGIALKCHLIEVYKSDCVDPANASTLRSASLQMQNF